MTTHEDAVNTANAPSAGAAPRLQVLARLCGGGGCPTVYTTDRETVVVQGYTVKDTDLGVPDGEHLVEIPVEVLLAAADKIRSQA